MLNELHLKYRPSTYKEVLGHKSIVKSLQKAVSEGSSQSFIFTGPSGTGKTTLARIVAHEIGCLPNNISEIDGASYSGKDDMKAITETMHYAGLGTNPTKMIIVDEAHSLSKAAWQSLLKSVEEPPSHVYWAFCTTEPAKIPETIKTRCLAYELKSISKDDLFELVAEVADKEEIDVDDSILDVVVNAAQGSPRRALTGLAKCSACSNRKEAAELLREADEDGEVIELCRQLMKGITWSKAMKILTKLKGTNPESIRLTVVSYFTSVAMKAADAKAPASLTILDAFSTPYESSGMHQVMLSLAQIIYGEE